MPGKNHNEGRVTSMATAAANIGRLISLPIGLGALCRPTPQVRRWPDLLIGIGPARLEATCHLRFLIVRPALPSTNRVVSVDEPPAPDPDCFRCHFPFHHFVREVLEPRRTVMEYALATGG